MYIPGLKQEHIKRTKKKEKANTKDMPYQEAFANNVGYSVVATILVSFTSV